MSGEPMWISSVDLPWRARSSAPSFSSPAAGAPPASAEGPESPSWTLTSRASATTSSRRQPSACGAAEADVGAARRFIRTASTRSRSKVPRQEASWDAEGHTGAICPPWRRAPDQIT
eukprot:1384986-Pyramimonas_sp.AAC.1